MEEEERKEKRNGSNSPYFDISIFSFIFHVFIKERWNDSA